MSPRVNDRIVATTIHNNVLPFNGTRRTFYKVVSASCNDTFVADRVRIERIKDAKDICFDVDGCMWAREEVVPMWDEVEECNIVICRQAINGFSLCGEYMDNNFQTLQFFNPDKRYYELIPRGQFDFEFKTLVCRTF